MKSSKLFLFGLLVSLSAYAHVQAAAAAEEVKEQAEVKEAAAAFDPSSKERTLEFLIKGFEAKRSEPVQWPAVLTKKIEDVPVFPVESLTLGKKHGLVDDFYISPDERYVALVTKKYSRAHNGRVIVYDLYNLQEKLNIKISNSRIVDIVFLPNSPHYSIVLYMDSHSSQVDQQKAVAIYDLNKPEKRADVLHAQLYAHDSKHVVVNQSGAQELALYSLPDLQKKHVFPDLGLCTLSPLGRYLAMRLSGKITIYDLEHLDQKPKVLEGYGIQFAPDEASFAVGAPDSNEIVFYQLPHFQREDATLEGWGVAFSPRGNYVVARSTLAHRDSYAKLYRRNNFEDVLIEGNVIFFFPDESHVGVKTNGHPMQQIYDTHNFAAPSQTLPKSEVIFSPNGNYALMDFDFGDFLYTRDDLTKPLARYDNRRMKKFSPHDTYLIEALPDSGITIYNLPRLRKKDDIKKIKKAAFLPRWFERINDRAIQQAEKEAERARKNEAEEKRFAAEQEEKKRLEAERIAADQKTRQEFKAKRKPAGKFYGWLGNQIKGFSSRWLDTVNESALKEANQEALDRAQAQEF